MSKLKLPYVIINYWHQKGRADYIRDYCIESQHHTINAARAAMNSKPHRLLCYQDSKHGLMILVDFNMAYMLANKREKE